MNFGIALREVQRVIQLEEYSIKIIDGNWGIFRQSFTNHMHSYYELHYVSGGQGTLVMDDFEMPLEKGYVYLIPPRTNHEQWSSAADFLKEYHLAFELIDSPRRDMIWERLFSKYYYNTKFEHLEIYFENIARESCAKQYGYQDMIYQNIQAIFITLIRSVIKNNQETAAPGPSLDDRRSMLIDDAFLYQYKTITLYALSSQLKLSTRQTQRFIKDRYKTSFSALKNQSRLSHAAMLLSTTKLPLEEVCDQVGYKNYSFFSRAFKRQYKITPVNYRKTHYHK